VSKRTILSVAVVGIAGAVASASYSHVTALRVTSTLSGRKSVPHRIRWVAFPKPRGQVARVDFLIDGKVRWVERDAPYVYGDDSNWLVTSWLKPGQHRFAVRVVPTSGKRVTSTVTARVNGATDPPSELAQSQWERTYTESESGDAPAGLWTLSITSAGWRIKAPEGGGNFIDVAYLADGLLETRGGIWTRPREIQKPNVQEGNGWCEETNKPVRFRWSSSENELTLTLAGASRCDGLGSFLSRTWARAR